MSERLTVKAEPERLEPTMADRERAAKNWARMDPKLRRKVERIDARAEKLVRAS